MKKAIAILAIIALIALSAAAESTGFGLRGTAWGMSRQEVLDIEGSKNTKADREAGFDVIERKKAKLYDIACEIEYFFQDDVLVACVCEYDTEDTKADFASLNDALIADYGDPIDPDEERWQLMKDILDGEMESRSIEHYSCWQLPDDTLVTLVQEVGDDSIELGFFDEMKLVEAML